MVGDRNQHNRSPNTAFDFPLGVSIKTEVVGQLVGYMVLPSTNGLCGTENTPTMYLRVHTYRSMLALCEVYEYDFIRFWLKIDHVSAAVLICREIGIFRSWARVCVCTWQRGNAPPWANSCAGLLNNHSLQS